MEFEWDEDKNFTNIKNHEGVSFEDATEVFNDIWAIDEYVRNIRPPMKEDLLSSA